MFMLLACISLWGQDGNKPLTAGGYLSSMQSAIFETYDGEWTSDNVIHNRLNFKWYAGRSLTFSLEMRNRIFTGDMVRLDPGFADITGSDRGWLDMSWNLSDRNSVLLNSFIDRLWVDFSGNSFQLRIGRQRINWGQALVWNPNDLFNVYSYFDFDYPERPGSDAIRLQVYPSYASTIELAAKVDSDDRITLAGLYRFNFGGYDIQFIGGYTGDENLVLGTGWSGAFGATSFRGEYSWFHPLGNNSDTSSTSILTIGFDRSFGKGYMIQAQAMYCNNPLEFDNFSSLYNGNLTARDIAFSEFSLFASFTLPLTPLFSASMSGIIYPGLDGYFAGPSIEASVASNVDLSLFWQHFDARPVSEQMKMNLLFLRFKYSF